MPEKTDQKDELWSHLSSEEKRILDEIEELRGVIYQKNYNNYLDLGFNRSDWSRMLRQGFLTHEKHGLVRSHVLTAYMWAEEFIDRIIISHFERYLGKEDIDLFKKRFFNTHFKEKLKIASDMIPIPKQHLEMIRKLKGLRDKCAHQILIETQPDSEKKEGLMYSSPYGDDHKEKNILIKSGFDLFIRDSLKLENFMLETIQRYSL